MPKTVVFTAIIHSREGQSTVDIKFPEHGISLETTPAEAFSLLTENGYVASASPNIFVGEHHYLTVFTKIVEESRAPWDRPKLPAFAAKLDGFQMLISAMLDKTSRVRTAMNPNIERLVLREDLIKPADFSRLGQSIFALFRDGSERKATIEEITQAFAVFEEGSC